MAGGKVWSSMCACGTWGGGGADGDGELVGQMVGSDGNVRGLQRMAGGKV